MVLRIGLGAICLFLAAVAGLAGAADHNFTGRAESGLGYDTNAFLAPDKSFFDPFSNTVVDPRPRSGFFIPVEARGEYAIDLGRPTVTPSLFFKGRLYPASDLRDADNTWINLESDLEYLLRKKGVYRDRLIITPSLAYNREIFVDRETGLERVATTQESLADRFTYLRYGLETALRVRSTPVKYLLRARVRKYDYQEVPALDSLDHAYYLVGAEGEYDITGFSTVKLALDYFVRDFENRRARDLDGNLVEGSDRKYTYTDFHAGVEREIGKDWEIELEYSRLERTDEFVGYFDYTRNAYSGSAGYRDKKERRMKAKLTFWDRDYPRAFAFDQRSAVEPGTGRILLFPRKEYKTWEVELSGEIPLRDLKLWGGTWALWAEYELIDQQSSDPRFDYGRHLVSAGIKAAL